jgi:hypothetical protein
MEKDQLWDKLVESGIATEAELKLVTCINGYTVETLNDVLYARTGERSWEEEEEDEE